MSASKANSDNLLHFLPSIILWGRRESALRAVFTANCAPKKEWLLLANVLRGMPKTNVLETYTETFYVFFLNFYFFFILLYNTVLVLPYIDMSQPRVYMSSQS